jgi:hypothetical protein
MKSHRSQFENNSECNAKEISKMDPGRNPMLPAGFTDIPNPEDPRRQEKIIQCFKLFNLATAITIADHSLR